MRAGWWQARCRSVAVLAWRAGVTRVVGVTGMLWVMGVPGVGGGGGDQRAEGLTGVLPSLSQSFRLGPALPARRADERLVAARRRSVVVRPCGHHVRPAVGARRLRPSRRLALRTRARRRPAAPLRRHVQPLHAAKGRRVRLHWVRRQTEGVLRRETFRRWASRFTRWAFSGAYFCEATEYNPASSHNIKALGCILICGGAHGCVLSLTDNCNTYLSISLFVESAYWYFGRITLCLRSEENISQTFSHNAL